MLFENLMYSDYVFWPSCLNQIYHSFLLLQSFPFLSATCLSHLNMLFSKIHWVHLLDLIVRGCTVIYQSISSLSGAVPLRTAHFFSDFTTIVVYKKLIKKLWEKQSPFVREIICLWHNMAFHWIQNDKDWLLIRKRKQHPTGITHTCRLYSSCFHNSSELDGFTFGLGTEEIPTGVSLCRRLHSCLFT